MRSFAYAAGLALLLAAQAGAQAPLSTPYECRGAEAIYHVGYDDNEPEWIYVGAEFFGARAEEQLEFALRADPSASGIRFARDFGEFRIDGSGAVLVYEGERMPCMAVAAPPPRSMEPGPVGLAGQALGGNMRNGPGTQYDWIHTLPEGAPLVIDAYAGVSFNGFQWFAVNVNQMHGYVWGGILCSEGQQLPGLYAQCVARATDAGPGGPAAWMAFAIDGRGGIGHGAASTEAQASHFAEQYCGSPDCLIADTTRAQCHALAHFIEGEAYYYAIASGERLDGVEYEALGRCDSASLGGDCGVAYSYCK